MNARRSVDVHVQPFPGRHLVICAAGIAVVSNGSDRQHQLRTLGTSAAGEDVEVALHEVFVKHPKLAASDINF